MDACCKDLIQKQRKMQSLLTLAQQMKEAVDNADLGKIDHLINERQVLMNDIDALDRMISQASQSHRNSGQNRTSSGKTGSIEIHDAIKILIDQIRAVDNETLEILNLSKNAVQKQITALRQERNVKRHANKFLNVKI